MKYPYPYTKPIIMWALALMLITGCATDSNTAAYRSLATIDAVVQSAMSGWLDYAVTHDVPHEEARVAAAYTRFLQARRVVFAGRNAAAAETTADRMRQLDIAASDLNRLITGLIGGAR
jgi:hypothetical protein